MALGIEHPAEKSRRVVAVKRQRINSRVLGDSAPAQHPTDKHRVQIHEVSAAASMHRHSTSGDQGQNTGKPRTPLYILSVILILFPLTSRESVAYDHL